MFFLCIDDRDVHNTLATRTLNNVRVGFTDPRERKEQKTIQYLIEILLKERFACDFWC